MATSPRRISRRALLALGLAVALGAAVPARAQPAAGTAAEAREAFLTGEAYYRKGDFKEAIAHYQRAYETKPHPSVLYNIGECYERLGQFDHAAEFYERYLRDLPAAKDRAKVAGKVEKFRALPSRVSVSSSPPGALVVVDGERRGRTPLIVELAPGDHDLEATYRDRGAQRRQIQCAYGRPQFVSFSFGARAGRLIVRTSIEGVELRVDGEVVGYTPYESDVAPGRHVVELTLYGYVPVRREVLVVAGTTNHVVERMQRLGGADQVDVRRDGATPFAPVSADGPPAGGVQQPAKPPVKPAPARYTIGGFGGAWAVRSVQDTSGMGGLSLGIHGGTRVADLAVDVAFPSPVTLDFYLRYYFGQAIFRPFVKIGLVIGFTPSKYSGASGASDARYGLSLGGGFALDVGSSLVLYVQAGVNMVGASGSSSSSSDGTTGTTATGTSKWLQIPVTAGLFFKL
ncbi:MAG TPA: PEGA domain-containing protein [Polyangia bacterium]